MAEWRIDLAHQISDKIKGFDGLKALAIGGSVARGCSDDFSDLELAAFWTTKPSPEIREDIIRILGGEKFASKDSGSSSEDNFRIKGFQIDLWHNEISYEEKVISSVLEGFSTNLSDNNFLETVENCIPLQGAELLNQWKERATSYPEKLGLKFIQENISVFHSGNFEMYLSRQDLPSIYNLIGGFQKRIFLVLLGLNRKYFPTFKWMLRTLPQLPLRPKNIESRFIDMYKAPPAKACEDLVRIMTETVDLVDGLPLDLSLTKVRESLVSGRARHVNIVAI